VNRLAALCKNDLSQGPATAIEKAFFATAAQESEAIGLALGLWQPGK
jgi:hypothetical protein